MRNLLKANFTRLWRSKIFYLAIIAMAGLAAFVCWNQWDEMREFDYVITLDRGLFMAQVVFGIAAAIFVSLFVGVEYSNGTIRNKILVGRKRIHIYLANFITCGAALTIVYAVSTAVALGLGTLLLEPSVVPAKHLGMAFGMGFFAVLAYTAIFNGIAMLLSNRTYTAIVAIMLAFGCMIMGVYVQNRLDQPEYLQQLVPGVVTDADEDVTMGVTEDGAFGQMKLETVPNPNYLSGAERDRFELFLDMNPCGQMMELVRLNIPHPEQILLCDLGIVLLFCLGGMALFQRKDIK